MPRIIDKMLEAVGVIGTPGQKAPMDLPSQLAQRNQQFAAMGGQQPPQADLRQAPGGVQPSQSFGAPGQEREPITPEQAQGGSFAEILNLIRMFGRRHGGGGGSEADMKAEEATTGVSPPNQRAKMLEEDSRFSGF